MKVTFDEYLEACDRSIENPDIPMPIPCASCEDEMMEYDEDSESYICPSCGREVLLEDKDEYLEDIVNGKYE